MDLLVADGIMAAGAGEVERSIKLARTPDLIRPVVADLSLLIIVVSLFEELFILKPSALSPLPAREEKLLVAGLSYILA